VFQFREASHIDFVHEKHHMFVSLETASTDPEISGDWAGKFPYKRKDPAWLA
jgi:hypothetical protein